MDMAGDPRVGVVPMPELKTDQSYYRWPRVFLGHYFLVTENVRFKKVIA